MRYSLEVEIDDNTYTFTAPAYTPVHSSYDAAAQFFLIMKKKMEKVNEELEKKAKDATPENGVVSEVEEIIEEKK